MKKMSETILFFGSGPVAAASLDYLVDHFAIEAVITKPQPPHHKQSFPVIDVVKKRGLRAYYPTNRHEVSQLFEKVEFTSPMGLVVDYGFIIGKDVIDTFALGIINSHFSLLPQWRGADPITFSILSGQVETGVSLMVIVEKLDEGKLIAQEKLAIDVNDTTPCLTNKLVKLSNHMLTEHLPGYLKGRISPYPQSAEKPTYSRKLTKEDGRINWSKPAEILEREIRAYIEWPRSYTKLGDKEVAITQVHVVNKSGQAGQYLIENKQLIVFTTKKALAIDKLKPAGKPEMSVESFLAGYKQFLS